MDPTCLDCLYCEERPDSNLHRRPWCRLWELWEPQERAAAWCEFGEGLAPAPRTRPAVAGEVRP